MDLAAAIEKLGLTPSPTGAPNEEPGEWKQLVAKFGGEGFCRVLSDLDQTILVEFAGDTDAVDAAINGCGAWEEKSGDTPYRIMREISEPFETLVLLDKLASALASGNTADLAALAQPIAENATISITSGDDDNDGSNGVLSSDASDGPFESIGHNAKPKGSALFEFVLGADDGSILADIGINETLDTFRFEALEKTISRNLRAKFDIDAKPISGPESSVHLSHTYAHNLHFRMTSNPLEGDPISVAAIEGVVGEYLQKIKDLASGGIDPLVFLGITRAKSSDQKNKEPISEVELSPTSRSTDDDDSDEVELGLSIDDVEMDTLDTGAPLTSGNFEDPRLREPDATTALVDVVLRHPSYSDKNMRQVLSILLSMQAHDATDLIEAAPIVVLWGVSRERAQTFKTVVEGAGGKVQLVEPGRYGAS